MIIKSMKRFNSLFLMGSLVVAAGLMACNNDDYGRSATDATTNADSVAASNTAAATANKPAAKVKKGRASVSMAGNSNATDNTASTASANKAASAKADKDGVYSQADVMPSYPGGEPALQQFVENNVTYPQSAMDADVEGTVQVSFVVDEKGMVTKPQVQGQTNAGSGLEQEALRVVQQMPKWTPGTIKGKPVKTRLQLPITFKLSET
jgi:periplasmic protein TonB